MAEEVKKAGLYKNIIGDAKETIEAIQRFLANNSPKKTTSASVEEKPAESINKVLNSVSDEEVDEIVQQIIDRL